VLHIRFLLENVKGAPRDVGRRTERICETDPVIKRRFRPEQRRPGRHIDIVVAERTSEERQQIDAGL
jgi:hypothetical protein